MHGKHLAALGIVLRYVIIEEHDSFDGAEVFFILNPDHSPSCPTVQKWLVGWEKVA